MRDLDVGPLPVCGDNDKLVGVLTDRNVVVRALAEGKDPRTAKVRDARTEGIEDCFEGDDVTEAARHLEDKQIRRLGVLNGDKRLVGIVSLGDLAVKAGDQALHAEALEQVSEPAAPRK